MCRFPINAEIVPFRRVVTVSGKANWPLDSVSIDREISWSMELSVSVEAVYGVLLDNTVTIANITFQNLRSDRRGVDGLLLSFFHAELSNHST